MLRPVLCLLLAACGSPAPSAPAPPPVEANYTAASIDWSASTSWARLPAERAAAFQDRLDGLDFPVLLPDHPAMAGAIVTSGPGWYAASVTTPEFNLVVQGNRNVFRDKIPFGLTPPSKDAWSITRVDGIAELTFVDMGAAYTLDLECEQPLTNPTCVEDHTIEAIARTLALVDTPALRAGLK